MGSLIDAKDPYTAGHSRRVATLGDGCGDSGGYSRTEAPVPRVQISPRTLGWLGLSGGPLGRPDSACVSSAFLDITMDQFANVSTDAEVPPREPPFRLSVRTSFAAGPS